MNLTALIVEDDPVLQMLHQKALKALSIDSKIAGTGVEAIQALKDSTFDFILMDINMPKLDGIAATRHIKTHYKEITVIGLSVHADRYYQDAMRDAGAVELLPKENATEDLYGAIQRAVAPRTPPFHNA